MESDKPYKEKGVPRNYMNIGYQGDYTFRIPLRGRRGSQSNTVQIFCINTGRIMKTFKIGIGYCKNMNAAHEAAREYYHQHLKKKQA